MYRAGASKMDAQVAQMMQQKTLAPRVNLYCKGFHMVGDSRKPKSEKNKTKGTEEWIRSCTGRFRVHKRSTVCTIQFVIFAKVDLSCTFPCYQNRASEDVVCILVEVYLCSPARILVCMRGHPGPLGAAAATIRPPSRSINVNNLTYAIAAKRFTYTESIFDSRYLPGAFSQTVDQ